MHRNSIESFLRTDKKTRQRIILNVLAGGKVMTCRQIAEALGFSDLNAVKPRICELKGMKIIKECGDVFDTKTRRPVMTLRIRPAEGRLF